MKTAGASVTVTSTGFMFKHTDGIPEGVKLSIEGMIIMTALSRSGVTIYVEIQ